MMQSKETLIKSYDQIAENYDSETDTFHHRISEYLTKENMKLELPKIGSKILDSGGGTGKYSIFLNELGYNVTLCDISPKSIEQANRKIIKLGLNIETVICDSENTPFKDNSFDMVIMNGAVISYTPSPEKILSEAYRILKNDGILWFDFFNTIGWAIENPDMQGKIDIALSTEKIIQMPDWDYPARLMSIGKVNELLDMTGFRLKTKYGLVFLSNSLNLDTRYSNSYDEKLLKEYCKVELELSRREDIANNSWSCSFCAVKIK